MAAGRAVPPGARGTALGGAVTPPLTATAVVTPGPLAAMTVAAPLAAVVRRPTPVVIVVGVLRAIVTVIVVRRWLRPGPLAVVIHAAGAVVRRRSRPLAAGVAATRPRVAAAGAGVTEAGGRSVAAAGNPRERTGSVARRAACGPGTGGERPGRPVCIVRRRGRSGGHRGLGPRVAPLDRDARLRLPVPPERVELRCRAEAAGGPALEVECSPHRRVRAEAGRHEEGAGGESGGQRLAAEH